MEKTIKKLGQIYYYIYTLTILATVVGYMLTINSNKHVDALSMLGITLKSIVIIYILISIPLSLGGFHRMTKKWTLIEDEALKFKTYEKGAILRLIIIGVGLLGSITVFFILRTDISLIYCFLITGIALFFCKPTIGKIVSELKLDESED
jgi:hypothetical protein